MSLTKRKDKIKETTRDALDDAKINISEASYPKVELKSMHENEKIRCGLEDETHTISKALYLNSELLSHPCEEM